jgi:hypothetical protein
MGRPTKYADKIAAEICARMVDGKSIRQIAAQADMPSRRTIANWLADPKHEAFRQDYARAGEQRGEVLVDEALEVSEGTLTRAKAGKASKEEVLAARLHVDTLNRRAGQLAPKKYGSLVRLAGEDGGALPLIIRRVRDVAERGSNG